MLPLPSPAARMPPFGLNAAACTCCELFGSVRVAMIFFVVVFHRKVLPLPSAVATMLPSWLKVTPTTPLKKPGPGSVRLADIFLDATFHRLVRPTPPVELH